MHISNILVGRQFVLCVCVWSCGRGGQEQQKVEERDEEEQLEEVILLQPNPLKTYNDSRGFANAKSFQFQQSFAAFTRSF